MTMKKNIVIAGGTGLIGSELVTLWVASGHTVKVLTRGKSRRANGLEYVHWSPENHLIENNLGPVDVLVNLAGTSVAEGRWTASRKKTILDSRVLSTSFLAEYFATNKIFLETYIGASAVGYYGNSGSQLMTEDDPTVSDTFLSEVCVSWEEEHANFKNLCHQWYILRIGVVLSMKGGALPKLMIPARMSISSYFGSGKDIFPWIHIDDLLGIMDHLLKYKVTSGMYNAVAPEPIDFRQLAAALVRSVNKYPIPLRMPSFLLKVVMGEMSETILVGNNVSSKKIERSGYQFLHPTIGQALDDLANGTDKGDQ